MKKRYILILSLVGLVLMTGCENGESMETIQTVTESSYETEILKETEQHTEDVSPEGTQSVENVEVETESSEEEQPDATTLEKFLKTALLPVGNTMYIWGGGWNEEDTGAGPAAVTVGVWPQWQEFAALQDETYNYKEHRYEILNGLDCSGYVGWAVYNLFETENGKEGYVFKSTETAATYSGYGWGELLENPVDFKAGDIVSMKGHVWICLGMCEDDSVVVMHASPPGVSICGTVQEGEETSLAMELAKSYMEKYYPKWQEKYPDRSVGTKYVTNVSLMRWNTETFEDAEEWQEMSAEEVLKLLFEE